MSVRQAPTYQQGLPERRLDDDSDVEEEALADDYREQVGYEDGEDYELDRSISVGGATQDLQAQLVAAAQPLEYGATLETKIQSYDSYCNLFHFILNSDGPVDIEVPSVCRVQGSCTLMLLTES
jgi:translation initiation factor 3 subunit L